MINLLTERVIESVEIDRQEYKINTDFRVSVQFEILIQQDLTQEEMIVRGIELYYPIIPTNFLEAVEKMLWFYGGGTQEDFTSAEQDKRPKKTKQVYSFAHDSGYIFSAFWAQYRIDLNGIEHLHWWKFRELFNNLYENNEFVKIMGYRSVNISQLSSNEEKKFYRDMQKKHKLPQTNTEDDQMQKRIEEALINGGDVSAVL